jgi:HAD superfamily hydrolase (TIGR01490 family)
MCSSTFLRLRPKGAATLYDGKGKLLFLQVRRISFVFFGKNSYHGVMKAIKKVAIFDIDGTIFRSSLLIEVTQALIAEGVFPQKAGNLYARSYRNWSNRKESYETYIWDVVRAFEKHIKGVRQKEFERIVKRVVARQKDKTYRYTRDLVEELKGKNYYLLAISHSPRELVYQFCRGLGFDKVYARLYEVGSDKTFTGNTLHKDLIANKATILLRAVEKEELDIKQSFGVGDTDSDIPFLSLVKHPICFNPNQKLYQHARKAGWKVVVERKDVVYEISND